MANVLLEPETDLGRTVYISPKLSEPVHIWSGAGGKVLCNTQHPVIVVRFDCVSQFSRESLCERCISAWQ